MPGVAGAVHLGARRHVRFVREDDFGEVPGGPLWVPIPYLEDGFKLKATSERWRPNTNYGGDFMRRVAIHHQLEVAGDFVTLPFPEVTQFLLDMALERDANEDIYSYSIDHYTPPDPRRYVGVVAERLVIAFADPDVRFTLSLRGKLESENNALVPGDFDYTGISPRPFMFGFAEFRINDVLYRDIETGTITIENNVAVGPKLRGGGTQLGNVGYLIAQQRAISFESTQLNRADDWDEAIRDGGNFSLDVRLYHPDGHLCEIQLPMMHVEQSDEDGTPDAIAKESPRFEAVAPDGGVDIIYGVDLAAGGTTTLVPLTTTAGPTTTTTPAPTTTTTP